MSYVIIYELVLGRPHGPRERQTGVARASREGLRPDGAQAQTDVVQGGKDTDVSDWQHCGCPNPSMSGWDRFSTVAPANATRHAIEAPFRP